MAPQTFCYPGDCGQNECRRRCSGGTRKGNKVSALALRTMKDATMIPEFDAGGFINLSREQRIAKCREMATEAERLASGKSSEMRASYLDLARKWSDLADEMETVRDA
jgi:hypothetical protein